MPKINTGLFVSQRFSLLVKRIKIIGMHKSRPIVHMNQAVGLYAQIAGIGRDIVNTQVIKVP
jgi:hypothetical protein